MSPFLFAVIAAAWVTHQNRTVQLADRTVQRVIQSDGFTSSAAQIPIVQVSTELLPDNAFHILVGVNENNDIQAIHIRDIQNKVNSTYSLRQLRNGAAFDIPQGTIPINVNPVGTFVSSRFTPEDGGEIELRYPYTVIPRRERSTSFSIRRMNGQWVAVTDDGPGGRPFTRAILVTNTFFGAPIGIAEVVMK